MAFFDPTHRAAGSVLAGRVAHLFTRPLGLLRDALERQATRRTLNALSDAQLEDIGLTRGDIDHL